MTTLADVLSHQDSCADCRPGASCAVAEALFVAAQARLVARFEPVPPRSFEVIDLHAHRATCTRCNVNRLCSVARAIAERAGSVLRDTGRRMVRA